MPKKTMHKIQVEAQKDFSYALNETGDYRESWRIFRIMAEFVEGYQFLSKLEREVTILGSARTKVENIFYDTARKLGKLLGENGFTTITGGGPGIMEAANRGAFEAGGKSVGLNIQLPFEQRINPYVKESAAFYYFFTRKVMLTSPANAFVYFPGGFGTMDEFFEVVDLMELGKMDRSPIVLVGKEYWNPLIDFLKNKSCSIGSVPQYDVDSWHVVDTAQEAFEFIKDTKDRTNSCELDPSNFHCKGSGVDWKIFRIMAELVEGFEFLTGLVEDVTVLGTKSAKLDSPYYDAAYQLGAQLADHKIVTVTGGGPGIMEAANKGAFENGGDSIGINMQFGAKERVNPYVKRSIGFQFPFNRKLILTAPSKAFVFFPGGFGTLHQLFEILTLIETKKMPKIPIILFDREFWEPMHVFIKKIFVHKFETISDEDDEMYQIVDTVDSAMGLIKDFRKQKNDTSSPDHSARGGSALG
ncbi:MAG: TIGR00730 family Rossman fold protein [Candidatus Magasanikbacteria bacterium]|nr:TIGR00730 family Rossman fold protein [Candidatus Magasanikbacteria bacterium]